MVFTDIDCKYHLPMTFFVVVIPTRQAGHTLFFCSHTSIHGPQKTCWFGQTTGFFTWNYDSKVYMHYGGTSVLMKEKWFVIK